MKWPARVEEFYADVAMIFHWGPAVMDSMALAELAQWRDLAVQRWNQVNSAAQQ